MLLKIGKKHFNRSSVTNCASTSGFEFTASSLPITLVLSWQWTVVDYSVASVVELEIVLLRMLVRGCAKMCISYIWCHRKAFYISNCAALYLAGERCFECHQIYTFFVCRPTYTLCLKKTSPMFLAITRESIVGFSQYFAEILVRKKAIKGLYIFPPHLINASALPCKTENTENVSFHVNVSCWFASRHTSHIGIIT